MTARYNIYFNGYESFKDGLAKIDNRYQDDYAEILKVFEFSDPATASYCSSDMERAIQKASKLIALKSITAKPEIKPGQELTEREKELLDRKEYNEWVDDSYLLIGMARFYKHEFKEADDVFSYCTLNANDPVIKEEATIWLARINNEQGNYPEAKSLLNSLKITGDDSRSLRAMYYTTEADMYVKQKKYEEAIEPLDKSIDLVRGKRNRYRLTYLLAQLYEQTGDGAKATELYHEVVKMNPPYDVEFNARINIAGVFDVNSGNPEVIGKELEKMLRNPKNKDFQDQIYFALGNLSMKEGKKSDALSYYRKSASAASQNLNQKGRAYLAMATYYYNIPDYMKAGKFYDSTVYFIDQKHPDYTELKARSLNLNALVSQLEIIQREDSLQRIAKMTETERNNYIAAIIDKVKKAESEGKTSQYSDRYNLGQYYENERRFQGNIRQEGSWYFYNQTALTFGRTEFRRRWGDRKLEDNWRRSNKTRVNDLQTTAVPPEGANMATDSTTALMNNKNPEFYLQNLPLTDSLMAQSNELIATAMMDAGKAYAEKLKDTGKAEETWESLIDRFPANDLVPEALYNLYNLIKTSNPGKAEIYRQKLLEKYPDSEYARILSDPAYYEKKMEGTRRNELLYEYAYDAFNKEDFKKALAVCDSAVTVNPKSNLAPKFMLLHAYSTARIKDERTFRQELNDLIKKWPGTEESKRATELIAYLNKKTPELKVEEDKKIAARLYTADTTSVQRFVLIITDPAFNINQATFDVISYNIDNFTNNNYKTEGTLINNQYIMITVSGFKNFNTALDYYRSFNAASPVRNQKGSPMMSFVIGDNNFKVLNDDKDPERYRLFFTQEYLK
ncbi:MAG TPA: tetratricopeptide repeat protein [Bacteroidales bacterium]|nr:tetratricopeptide repeat protein [Bacteroidales bacterium]